MRKLRAALAALALWLAPAAALALPPVWIVKDHDATLVMFGSVHLLPPDTRWRPPELEDALSHADQVWFEAPMDTAGLSAATQAALAHAFLPHGESLQEMLSPGGRQRLQSTAKLLGVQAAHFDGLQPWYAELMIQSALFERLGVKGSDGVEQQLWAGLSPEARRVTLETPQEQVDFFADAPMSEQLASLEQTLKDVPKARSDYDELLKAWLEGDIHTLDRKVVEPLKKTSPSLYARVVTQRNARWVKAIDERLKSPGETVIVVGMGHLIGPDGVPARLRAQGYKVEGPR